MHNRSLKIKYKLSVINVHKSKWKELECLGKTRQFGFILSDVHKMFFYSALFLAYLYFYLVDGITWIRLVQEKYVHPTWILLETLFNIQINLVCMYYRGVTATCFAILYAGGGGGRRYSHFTIFMWMFSSPQRKVSIKITNNSKFYKKRFFFKI